MRDVKTIFWKEFRGYFNSPVAYIVIIAWLILSSWFFASGLFVSNQAQITGFFDLAPLFFLFIIPAICMQLLAEEEKLGTVELLTTMPLQDWTIITGKYLAAFAVIKIGILCTLIYPISIAFLGKLDWGVVISSYFGLLLLGAGFCAIGIFTSSVTKSQVIAFILNFVICFVFFILGKILGTMSSGVVTILQYFGIDYHLESMGIGVIDSRSVIYFLSMIAFFLCFTFYFYRKAKHRILSGISVTVLLAIIIVANILSYRIFARLDLSSGKIYSLSKASVQMIRNLEDPVIVRAYMTAKLPYPYNTRSKYVKDLLSEYKIKSRGKLKFELINPSDPDKKIDQDKKIEAQRAGIAPLQFQDRQEAGALAIKEGYMGLLFLYGDKKEVIPVIDNFTSLEYDITSRIKKLTETSQKSIGFTKGHNEVQLDERLKQEIQKRYMVSDVNIDSNDVPSNLSALMVLGPKGEYNDTALLRVKNFLDAGKSCGFFLDMMNVNTEYFFAFPSKTGFDKLLSGYNITLKNGLVLDYQNQIIGITSQRGNFRMQNLVPYPFFPKATDLNKSSSIVRELEAVVLPFVGAINGGTPLIKSSPKSWLKQDVKTINPMEQQFPTPTEEKGPFNLAVINEKPRFIVTGSSKFAEANYLSTGNVAFLLNTIDWLVADEDLITIRSKGIAERPLKNTNTATKMAIKWIDTLLPSLILIIIGFVRLRKRNNRIYEI
ncbi:MAG: Gldg family protein [bacterium]|nr:Gldg family protein [bacterium]